VCIYVYVYTHTTITKQHKYKLPLNQEGFFFFSVLYSSRELAAFDRLLNVKYASSFNAKIQCCNFKLISPKFHLLFL